MMELGLILTLCGLGVSFLIPAVIIYAISANKKRKCTKSADAVVVDIETRSSDDHRLSFYPVYEYYADGIKYTGVGATLSNRTPNINDVVPVMYNPDKPKQSYIIGYDNKVYKILSIVFTVVGFIPIIIYILIAVLT